jgi:hypothetical protein
MTPRPKVQYPKSMVLAIRVSETMLADLQSIQTLDGIPISEQVRRGIRLWLQTKESKTDRKRATTRKRP